MDLKAALAIFSALEEEKVGWVDDLTDEGRTGPKHTVRLDANYASSEEYPRESRYFSLFIRNTHLVDEPIDAFRYILEVAEEHGAKIELDNSGLRLF